MPASSLPLEVSELILECCDSLRDASALAQTSSTFSNAWQDPYARLRICKKIMDRRYPYLKQVELTVENQLQISGSEVSDINRVTRLIVQVHDLCQQTACALTVYEKGAEKRVSQDRTLNPFDLPVMGQEDFVETFLHLCMLAFVPKAEHETWVESLPQDQASRLEKMAYWVAALSKEDVEELQDSSTTRRSAVDALDARNGPMLRSLWDTHRHSQQEEFNLPPRP